MTVQAMVRNRTRRVITIDPDATIADACQLLKAERIGAVVVSSDGRRVAGILSERDIVRCLADQGANLLDQPVSGIMTREVQHCRLADKVVELLGRMTEGRFRHMPIVEDGVLIGMVSIGDIVKYRMEEMAREAEAMRDMIAGGVA